MDELPTDPFTGWPIGPVHPCYKGPRVEGPTKSARVETLVQAGLLVIEANEALRVVCHLRLSNGHFACIYGTASCPFYGHFPGLPQFGSTSPRPPHLTKPPP